MKKIFAPIILIAIVLISGACGGGGSSWSAEEKSKITYMYAEAGLSGEELECAVDYTAEHWSYGEYMYKVERSIETTMWDPSMTDAVAKACDY